MFKVGDRVKIVTTYFHDDIGTVIQVIPGRSPIIPSEFVVNVQSGRYTFFEHQLISIDAIGCSDRATAC